MQNTQKYFLEIQLGSSSVLTYYHWFLEMGPFHNNPLSGTKLTNEKLNIENELQIITAPNDVYNVRCELVSVHS